MGIPNRVGEDSFGICMPDTAASIEESGQFSYMAAVAVENLDTIPRGMTGIEIPTKTYAVFSYDGGIDPDAQQYDGRHLRHLASRVRL